MFPGGILRRERRGDLEGQSGRNRLLNSCVLTSLHTAKRLTRLFTKEHCTQRSFAFTAVKRFCNCGQNAPPFDKAKVLPVAIAGNCQWYSLHINVSGF